MGSSTENLEADLFTVRVYSERVRRPRAASVIARSSLSPLGPGDFGMDPGVWRDDCPVRRSCLTSSASRGSNPRARRSKWEDCAPRIEGGGRKMNDLPIANVCQLQQYTTGVPGPSTAHAPDRPRNGAAGSAGSRSRCAGPTCLVSVLAHHFQVPHLYCLIVSGTAAICIDLALTGVRVR